MHTSGAPGPSNSFAGSLPTEVTYHEKDSIGHRVCEGLAKADMLQSYPTARLGAALASGEPVLSDLPRLLGTRISGLQRRPGQEPVGLPPQVPGPNGCAIFMGGCPEQFLSRVFPGRRAAVRSFWFYGPVGHVGGTHAPPTNVQLPRSILLGGQRPPFSSLEGKARQAAMRRSNARCPGPSPRRRVSRRAGARNPMPSRLHAK